jgi:hypothetical protein
MLYRHRYRYRAGIGIGIGIGRYRYRNLVMILPYPVYVWLGKDAILYFMIIYLLYYDVSLVVTHTYHYLEVKSMLFVLFDPRCHVCHHCLFGN